MKSLLLIGNITFHHLVDEELELFKNPNAERKALVHDIECIVECESEDEAGELGEDALCNCCESYVIPSVFNGEVVYECENNLRPISVEDFIKDYLK
jgi:hypothetical protein